MKKLLSLLLAGLILLLSALPALAVVDYLYGQGIYYDLSEDGEPSLSDMELYAFRGARELYVPKTVAGVALTPEDLTGENIFSYAAAFRVDDDNAYFTVREGMLYTKDGKTLVYCPRQYIYGWNELNSGFYGNGGVFRVPEGTERLGRYSVDAWRGVCIVLPDSVVFLDENCGIEESGAVAAAPGGEAESWAQAHNVTFVPLGEGHEHVWFHTFSAATCVSDGRTAVECPCGEVARVETAPADPDAHEYEYIPYGPDGSGITVCERCGKTEREKPADCSCGCHTMETSLLRMLKPDAASFLKDFFFRVKLMIWRLTGTHQYCECGARHY